MIVRSVPTGILHPVFIIERNVFDACGNETIV